MALNENHFKIKIKIETEIEIKSEIWVGKQKVTNETITIKTTVTTAKAKWTMSI